MDGELTTAHGPQALETSPKVHAFLGSILVAIGAALAAVVAIAALVVAFPLMLAASATVRGRRLRRGWTELEPVEA